MLGPCGASYSAAEMEDMLMVNANANANAKPGTHDVDAVKEVAAGSPVAATEVATGSPVIAAPSNTMFSGVYTVATFSGLAAFPLAAAITRNVCYLGVPAAWPFMYFVPKVVSDVFGADISWRASTVASSTALITAAAAWGPCHTAVCMPLACLAGMGVCSAIELAGNARREGKLQRYVAGTAAGLATAAVIGFAVRMRSPHHAKVMPVVAVVGVAAAAWNALTS